MPSFTIDTTVDINAGKDAVWDVLTDFASYEEWNPVMRIEGVPEVGTKLVVHLIGGMSFKPKVLAATPGKELRWVGKLGLREIAAGEHFFVLTTNQDGTTRLNHGERYSGALVALTKHDSRSNDTAYEAFSQALKQRVEQLHETPATMGLTTTASASSAIRGCARDAAG
jgi:hypothetical protein